MTDEITPSDANEQTRDAIERLLPKAVAQLEELIQSGGKPTTKRVHCPTCGTAVNVEVKVADAELLVKAVSALSSAAPRLKTADDSTSRRGREILKELEDMPSEELAELIAELERERDAAGD